MNLKVISIFFLIALLCGNCHVEGKNLASNTEDSTLAYFIKKGENKKLNLKERLNYLDSTKTLLKSYPRNTDSLTMAILYTKGLEFLSQKQNDSFYFLNKVLANKAISMDNPYFLGKSQFNLGYYYDELAHRPDSAFFYYQQAKNTYFKIRNTTEAIEILINIALLQKNQNDFYGAKETLTEAIGNLNNDSESLVSIYNEIATNNRKLLNYSDAEKYYQLAINNTNVKKKIIRYRNNLATLYIETKNYDSAIFIFEKLLEDNSPNGKSTTYARIWDNYTYAKWKNGDYGLELGFIESLNIRKEKNDRRGQIASYTHLGEYFHQTHPQKAEKYLDTVILLSKQLKIPKAEADALKFLMVLKPKSTIFKDRYIFLKDSLYQQELKVKTQFAHMKYNDEQEKKKILQLEAETIQKRADIAEQRTQKVVFLSLSGLLLIGGTLLYYIIKQRHKKEKLKEVYDTEKRISKVLHDTLANDIYGVMTTVEENFKEKSTSILDNLEDIYNRARDISHDTGAVNTGTSFEGELRNMLGLFQCKETKVMVKGLQEIDWSNLEEFKCIAIHRALKELMVNMRKHSQASLVAINFERTKKRLITTYSDNGIGCSPNQKLGLGLQNTDSRIHSVNGTFKFIPKPKEGVRVILTIPF